MKQILISILGFFLAGQLCAQPLQNNLLSRYGIGLALPSQPAAIYNMGGASAGFRDAYQINPENPASLAFLEHVSFEVGLFAKHSTQYYGENKLFNWSGNIRHLMLALPTRNPYTDLNERIRKKGLYTTALLLKPISQVGYNIISESSYPGNDTVVTRTNLQGEGGLYQFDWLNAYRYNNFAAGLGLGVQFGGIKKSQDLFFDNLPNAYRESYDDQVTLSGFTWNAGLQYDIVLKTPNADPEDPSTSNHLVLGMYGHSNTSFRTEASSTYFRSSIDFNLLDTILNTSADPIKYKGTLPGTFGIGAMYEKPNKMRLSAGFKAEPWSRFKNDWAPYTYGNAWHFQLGGEFTPEYNSFNNYLRKIKYRAGVQYGQERFLENGVAQKSFSVRAGFGLPIKLPRKQVSGINLGFEYGTLSGDKLGEEFFQVQLGIQLNDDSWFYKRKYD